MFRNVTSHLFPVRRDSNRYSATNRNRHNSMSFNNIRISNRYKNGPSASSNRSKIAPQGPAMNRHLIRAAPILTCLWLLVGPSVAAAQSATNQSAAQSQVQSGFAEINGGKIYYEVAGSGHPLVLIHGGQMDRRMWDEQFDLFSKSYRVIRYDVRGFGKSPASTNVYADEEDLAALLKYLQVDKAYIVGLSLGGRIAIDFALTHPDMTDGDRPRRARPERLSFQRRSECDWIAGARRSPAIGREWPTCGSRAATWRPRCENPKIAGAIASARARKRARVPRQSGSRVHAEPARDRASAGNQDADADHRRQSRRRGHSRNLRAAVRAHSALARNRDRKFRAHRQHGAAGAVQSLGAEFPGRFAKTMKAARNHGILLNPERPRSRRAERDPQRLGEPDTTFPISRAASRSSP